MLTDRNVSKTLKKKKEAVSCPSTPTCLLFEVEKELLVEDKGHAADLLHLGLGGGVPVDEVGSDGDGQLPPELLPFKACGETKRAGEGMKRRDTRLESAPPARLLTTM